MGCQSCGMPLSKDPQGGGSNKDGSKSGEYCSFCYGNGMFLQPNMTLEEMKTFCQNKMAEMGFPRFLAKLFTMRMHKLKRWCK